MLWRAGNDSVELGSIGDWVWPFGLVTVSSGTVSVSLRWEVRDCVVLLLVDCFVRPVGVFVDDALVLRCFLCGVLDDLLFLSFSSFLFRGSDTLRLERPDRRYVPSLSESLITCACFGVSESESDGWRGSSEGGVALISTVANCGTASHSSHLRYPL